MLLTGESLQQEATQAKYKHNGQRDSQGSQLVSNGWRARMYDYPGKERYSDKRQE